MFTGLVEDMGAVGALRFEEEARGGGCELTVRVRSGSPVLEGVELGASIAVNGVCLTVTKFQRAADGAGWFMVGLAPETLRRTNLGDLKEGDAVNLERSLAANGRVGGHFVQGHVDGTGTVASTRVEKDSLWVTVRAAPELLRYIVEKGYIAVDGTSLTVCAVDGEGFTFMLVAYTQQRVTLPGRAVGARVNLEVDVIAKYVEKFLGLAQRGAAPLPPVAEALARRA